MEYNNRLNRTLDKLNSVPAFARLWMRDKAIGRAVPLVGTAGLKFSKMTCEEVVISVDNRKKVQNHIQQVHAAAMILLAETASGMVVGMNVPDDKLPLIKTIHTKFIKRTEGDIEAKATLTPEQIKLIRTTDKGDTPVTTIVRDATGEEVIIVEMIWAWVTKKK